MLCANLQSLSSLLEELIMFENRVGVRLDECKTALPGAVHGDCSFNRVYSRSVSASKKKTGSSPGKIVGI